MKNDKIRFNKNVLEEFVSDLDSIVNAIKSTVKESYEEKQGWDSINDTDRTSVSIKCGFSEEKKESELKLLVLQIACMDPSIVGDAYIEAKTV